MVNSKISNYVKSFRMKQSIISLVVKNTYKTCTQLFFHFVIHPYNPVNLLNIISGSILSPGNMLVNKMHKVLGLMKEGRGNPQDMEEK